ncbi:MAG TPA: peptidase domain-containing ABC transporter [Planctomycetota bacterium]|nr:peptidase domain-containing ABC transporter [Planctomycetota bacterium]
MDATQVIAQHRMSLHRPVPVLKFLRAYPYRTLMAAFTGLVVGMLGWGVALLVQNVVDHTGDLDRLYVLALAVTAVLILRGGLSLVRRSLQVHLARGIESKLADRYLDHVTQLEMRFYEKYHTGDLMNRLRGIEVLRNAFEDRFLGVTFDAVLVLIAAVVMARHSIAMAALATVGASIPAVVIVVIRNSIKRSFEDMRQIDGDMSNHCMDALQGVRDLRLTEGESWIRERIKGSYRHFQDFRIRHMMKLTMLGAGTVFVSAMTSVVVLVMGARLVGADLMTQGQLMFMFTMAGTMLGPLEQLASTWISFDEASVAFSRYNEILSLPAEPREGNREPELDVRGDIRLDQVTFGYRNGAPILNAVSLNIEAGMSVAIVGESGAGKSTMLSLLSGLYEPDEGSIRIDGRDLRAMSLEQVRRHIGVVFQSPHLFNASIEENIRMGCWNATEEDVRRAARLAHADGFIERLPQGYKTPIQRAGATFSGGQVQRIAIARALVGRPRILLLDEATGNLDAQTEGAIWTALTESELRCTRVFVTHRLSTTCQTDRIIVVEKGKIAETGTFEELMRLQGHFYKLWRRQVPAITAA